MSDVLIVGGGPAGAVCAALCARAGMRVIVLERATFPREKVCGDCLNPACWPILDRLGVAESVLELPHARLSTVVFVDAQGRSLAYPLPASERGEIAVKRSDLDALLLDYARACGAEVHEGTTVTAVEQMAGGTWQVSAGERAFTAPQIIAADGRNSTVARLLGRLPAAAKDRVGLQTHLPLPKATAGRVVMRFLPQGYCGLADVGADQANLCLVSHPAAMESVKAWATAHFGLEKNQPWRSITPLQRASAAASAPGLLLVGDAARVVEPFTGEGIYYALATGALAADCLLARDPARYAEAHRALYRGRLWVNVLARFACKYPAFASAFLGTARIWPAGLGWLTGKVIARPEKPRSGAHMNSRARA